MKRKLHILAALTLAAPLTAHAYPAGDWAGVYDYIEGGRAGAVERRLTLTPTLGEPACTLVTQGERIDEEIECALEPAERGVAIRFRRYVRKGPGVPDVVLNRKGEMLFALHRERQGSRTVLVTHWRGLVPEGVRAKKDKPRGVYFKMRPDPSARPLGIFGKFSHVREQDDCLGRLFWLRRRGDSIEGEIAPYEGPCETVKAAIVQSTFDPETGALTFQTEPWIGGPADPVGWRFEGRLSGGSLQGTLRSAVPATGENRSAQPEKGRFPRLPGLPRRLQQEP